jgi:quinol-cytochrome oxidoreductase complex cytochrome b subunit
MTRLIFWCFINRFFLLTWLGRCVPAYPFIIIGQAISISYFLLFAILLFYLNVHNKCFII